MKSQSLLIALLVLSLSAQAQPRTPRRVKAAITPASSRPAATAEIREMSGGGGEDEPAPEDESGEDEPAGE